MINCVGNTYADYSFMVMCCCGGHAISINLMEDVDGKMCPYISFYGELYKKCRWSEVYFESIEDFKNFLDFIVAKEDKSGAVFYSKGIVNNKSKILGRLELEYDEYGYLDFRYYKKEKPKFRSREKTIWCVFIKDAIEELISEAKKMLEWMNNRNE